MSKKIQKSPKKGVGQKKQSAFPLCLNKNEARMVCLSQECSEYPFFCSYCEDSSCQIAHQHSDKLVSVSFKQFTKRVLKERKPSEPLADAMNSYRKVLQKLKQDVSEFIEKQLAQLDEITKKAEEMPEQDGEIIGKLKNQQYQGMTGTMMDQLWANCAQNPEKQQAQEETAEFIKIKEEQVKGISEHFEHLNQMDFDNIPEDKEEEASKKKKEKVSNSQAKTKK